VKGFNLMVHGSSSALRTIFSGNISLIGGISRTSASFEVGPSGLGVGVLKSGPNENDGPSWYLADLTSGFLIQRKN
ncbi:hypothetical protein PIB30_114715, partial [Stylosanthes scabra]|nr:hypothetical protein [Stylosanthes scabra]